MSPSSFHAASLRLPVPRLISSLGVFAFGLAGWLAFSVMEEERALEALFQENSQVIERAQAAEKWAQKGEEGIPRLREALVSSNSRVREYALLAFIYMPRPAARLAYTDLLPLCEDEVPSVQANALALVADLTDQPEKLAPLMASRLLSSSTDIVEAAQNGLDRLGPAAVPQIAKIFPQANPDIQEICLLLLMQSSHDEVMGLRARRTIGEAAQSPHAAVRTLAYQLISSIRPLSAREISAGLKDAQPEILKIALMQYANGVKPNLRDLPTLLKVLESERKFRPQVLEGLGQFPAAAETFSVILPWTDDENPAVRIAAMKALVRSADEPARAVPVLVRMVSDSHPRVSAVAGNLLAEADPNTAENVVQSVLLPRLQSDEPAVQIGAAGALSEMPQAAAHRLTLIRLLSAESSASPVTPMVQYQLAEALGNIGPLAQDAVPALLNLIQRTSPHDPLLIVPVTALGKIGYADRTVLDVLIRLHGLPRRHHGSRLHSGVIATLGKVGFGNKDVLTLLLSDASHAQSSEVRLAALKALAALHTDRETTAAAYASALKSENVNLRLGACLLLAEQDNREDAEEVAWDMITLLEDCSPYVRTVAAKILAGLGPDAASALPALSKALAEKTNQIPNRYELDEEIDWSLFDKPVRDLQNQTVSSAVSSAMAAIQSEASAVQTSLLAKESNR